jgi:hypothetical protein
MAAELDLSQPTSLERVDRLLLRWAERSTTDATLRLRSGRGPAHGAALWGLSAHVYAQAARIRPLIGHGEGIELAPVVRAMLECSLRAQWLAQRGPKALPSFLHDGARQRLNLGTRSAWPCPDAGEAPPVPDRRAAGGARRRRRARPGRHPGARLLRAALVGTGGAAGAALRPAAPAGARRGGRHRGRRLAPGVGHTQDPRPPLGAAAAVPRRRAGPHGGDPPRRRAGLPLAAGRGAPQPQRPVRLVRRRGPGHRTARTHAARTPAHRGLAGDQGRRQRQGRAANARARLGGHDPRPLRRPVR